MNKEFTESEWSKMSCMVNVIWGVDIDKVKLWNLERKTTDRVIIPVLDPAYGPKWYKVNPFERPVFTQELVEVDRWLIPWQVKAGYSAQLNMLVYRVEP